LTLVVVQGNLLEGTVNDGGGLEGGGDLSNASNHFCVCVLRVVKGSVKKKEKEEERKKEIKRRQTKKKNQI